MKAFLTAIASLIVALALTALVVVAVYFPETIVAHMPGWVRPLDVQGGAQVVLEIEPEGVELAQAVEESIRIIERRLADLRTKALVQRRDAAQIVVGLPRSADAKRAIEVATRRGKLEFRMIDVTMTPEQAIRGRPPPGSEVLYDRGRTPYLVERRVVISGRDLIDAQPSFDARTSEPIIVFRFNAVGTRRFARVTQENVGRPFAMVVDSEVLSAPVIREPILGGSGQISGNMTVQQANDLAILLRAGELPGRLKIIEQRAPQP